MKHPSLGYRMDLADADGKQQWKKTKPEDYCRLDKKFEAKPKDEAQLNFTIRRRDSIKILWALGCTAQPCVLVCGWFNTKQPHLKRECRQLEHDVRFNFEGSSEDETPGLEVKEFDGSILGQVRDRLDEELDEEVDREDGRFPRQVVVKNFSVQLKPEQQNQF